MAFDVAQKGGGAEAEEVGLQPRQAQFVFDERKIDQRIFGFGDAACGFVADLDTGAVIIVADRAQHGQGDRQGGVDGFLAGRGLDEIGTRHHADERGAGDVSERAEFAGREDGFHMGIATSGAHFLGLIVEGLPVLGQDMAARDDDVDLARASLHTCADLGDAQGIGREPGRKAGRDGGDRDGGAFQRADSGFDHGVVDADRPGGEVGYTQGLQQFGADRVAGFGAQALDAARGVIAG